MSCFNPERIKDILFDIHDISPEKSHVAVSLHSESFVSVISYQTVTVIRFR